MDVPDDFDPGYTIQERCDCGNDKWEPGEIEMGTVLGKSIGKMKVNKCTICGNAQLLYSNEYLKRKREKITQ